MTSGRQVLDEKRGTGSTFANKPAVPRNGPFLASHATAGAAACSPAKKGEKQAENYPSHLPAKKQGEDRDTADAQSERRQAIGPARSAWRCPPAYEPEIVPSKRAKK